MYKLLIVEDDTDIQELLENHLCGSDYEVTLASDGVEAISLFAQRKYDLVLLDIMLPKMSGLNVLKQIRKSSSIPVIMLTAMDDTDTQIMSFDGLADDYVIKPFSIVLLGKRVTALLRRVGKTEPEKIWQQGDVMVDFSGFSAEKAGISVDISPKEVLLLKMLVEHPGVVLTREQILNYIWGIDIPLNDRTIDTYVGRLRKKLDLDCIQTIKGVGYKFEVKR